MNEHLKPAFSILSEFEKTGIEYWVYGGVSIAACVGHFIRRNKDVDVFVKEVDFDRTRSFLDQERRKHDLGRKYLPAKSSADKPKFELRPKGQRKDLLSVIPIYMDGGNIVFKYPKPEIYAIHILNRIGRRIDDFRFFTPPDEYIKEIFINHIKARPDKKDRPEFITDARAILSAEELAGMNWSSKSDRHPTMHRRMGTDDATS